MLNEFYRNQKMREEFVAFYVQILEGLAVKDMYAGKDVKHYQHSKVVIDAVMTALKEKYEPNDAVPKKSQRNV